MRWTMARAGWRCGHAAAGPALLLAALLGCAAEPSPRPRAVDPQAARVATLPRALPPGLAQAFFALDTGADQAGGARREAGLVVVLRAGTREERRTVASCREPALGSALGDRVPPVIDIAFCGSEFQLRGDARQLAVVRMDTGGEPRTVVNLPLPAGVERIVGEAP